MKLPRGPNNADRALSMIEQEDMRNLNKGQDLRLGAERVVLLSPDGTAYALVVDNAGVLSTVAA